MGSSFLMSHKNMVIDPDLTLKDVHCLENVDDIIDCCPIPILCYNSLSYGTITGGLPLAHGWYALALYDVYSEGSSAIQAYFNYRGNEIVVNQSTLKTANYFYDDDEYYQYQYSQQTLNGLFPECFGGKYSYGSAVHESNIRLEENTFLFLSRCDTSTSSKRSIYLTKIIYNVIDANTIPTYTKTDLYIDEGYAARICKLNDGNIIVFYKTNYNTVKYKIITVTSTLAIITSGEFTDECTNYWQSNPGSEVHFYPLSDNKFLQTCRKTIQTSTDEEGYPVYTSYNAYRPLFISSSYEFTFGEWLMDDYVGDLYPLFFEKDNYKIIIQGRSDRYSSVSGVYYDVLTTLCISPDLELKRSVLKILQGSKNYWMVYRTYYQVPSKPFNIIGLGSAQSDPCNITISNINIINGVANIDFICDYYETNCDYISIPQFNGNSGDYFWDDRPSGWYDKYALEDKKEFMLAHGSDSYGYHNTSDGQDYYYQRDAFTPIIIFNADYLANQPNGSMNTNLIVGKVTGSIDSTVKGKFLLKK